MLLSYGLWQEKFGGNEQILGQSIALNGEFYTVVGVMGPRFVASSPSYRLWVPADLNGGIFQKFPDAHFLRVVGRLAHGISEERLSAELRVVETLIHELDPANNRKLMHAPLREISAGKIRGPLLLLLGAVGAVLLIACANVASLFLSRAVARQQEIAVRIALGAGRGRIVRQLLLESVLVSLFGGGAGIAVAAAGLRALVGLSPSDIPGIQGVGLEWRVLTFAGLVALATGVMCGLVPATTSWTEAWRETLTRERQGTSSAKAGRLRNALVFAEIALSFVLLTSAGLTLRSFSLLQAVDTGFRPVGVLTASIVLPETRYREVAQMRAFSRNVLERLRALPGVQLAALDTHLPFTGEDWGNSVQIEGHPAPPGKNDVVQVECISPSYFATMSIVMEAGRDFDEHDSESSQAVAIVDSVMAREFWPGESPIGRRINVDGPWRTVVGVAHAVKKTGLGSSEEPQLYVPYLQLSAETAKFVARGIFLVVKSSHSGADLAGSVRASVASLDPQLALTQLEMMERLVYDSVAEPRFRTLLLGIFSAIALALACVGVYGVVSYGVTQRVHEIGVHVALGAHDGDIFRLIVSKAMLLGGEGIVVGLLGSLVVGRLFSTLLFRVSAYDPVTMVGAIVVQLGIVLGASYLPARGAMRIDPMVALRYE